MTSADARSRCVQVDVDVSDLDRVSGLLWEGGVTGVQEIDLGNSRVRLVAGLAADSEGDLASLLGADRSPVFFDADYDGWLDAWRPFARPVRVGRLVVAPPWERVAAGDAEIVVEVDPGRSFGAGNHPTTRLMLELLQEVIQPGSTVLDAGSGSGVLAVVAAVLGAGRVRAVDIEEEALTATRANAVRNRVADRVEVSGVPLEEIREEFDVVLANILAPVLIELAPVLSTAVAEGGSLLLSGMLAEQVADVADAYPGWEVVETVTEGGWQALLLGRARLGTPS